MLVEKAFAHLKRQMVDLSSKQEPAITGLLVQAMQDYLEALDSPDWVLHYHVHDDPPQNIDGREGSDRPRVDIEIVRADQRGRRPRFAFEAKRLYSGAGVTPFLGHDGLGCFLNSRYACNETDAGMLGYTQSRTTLEWAGRVSDELTAHREVYGLSSSGAIWAPHRPHLFDASFCASHTRADGSALTIHYTFLDCCRRAPV